MSFYDFINRILGITGRRQDSLPSREDGRPNGSRSDEFRNPIWNWDDDDDDEDDFRSGPPNTPFGFRIFSDPLEIHKFFEHQMEEFMRNFSMFDTPGMPGVFNDEMVPQLPAPDSQNKGSLRDQFLKPGYERADSTLHSGSKRQDQDLDDRVSAGELDKILGGKPTLESDAPHSLVPAVPGIQSKIFGKSVTSKTVRRPDGSVEIHRTVRDSQGNEETTVTQQMGDQSYTVTIHIDPNGAEQRTENYYNMEEEDLEDFKKRWSGQQPRHPFTDNAPKPHNWFPFDKFFK